MSEGQGKWRYQSLFFVGIAIAIVLLPFPNVFGILLDAGILALAYPIVGGRTSLVLVYAYNFNPLKLNGVIVLYSVLYTIVYSLLAFLDSGCRGIFASVGVIAFMLVVTLVEFLVIRAASATLWRFLAAHDPRLRHVWESKF